MSDLLALCRDLPIETLADGEALIEAGTPAQRMYVLVSGEVTVERDGVAFARIDTPGAVFGEMAVVLGQPTTATVRASSAVTAHVIEQPHRFLAEQPGAALAVLRVTASRLDGLTHYLVDVKRQFAEEGNHLAMMGSIIDTLVHYQSAPTRTGSVRDPEG